jgi:hypothetical protein
MEERMLEGFRIWRRVRALQQSKRELEASYDAKIKAAEKAREWERHQQLIGELFMERDLIEDELFTIMSRRVRELAERYLIPVPDYQDDSPDWVKSRIDDRVRLSEHAIARLRSKIRGEQRERHDQVLRWLAALTGVIGALTGLIAVIL